MTPLSRFFSIFPALQLGIIALATSAFTLAPSLERALALLAAVYVVPLGVFRWLEWAFPLSDGPSYLDGPDFSPWWAGHQTQAVLNALPSFEALMRLIPGLYSAWLRLWGSRVGADVYWTARVEVLDRNLLEIGDGVVVGHKVFMSGHIIKRTRKGVLLWVRGITVGNGAFLGAECSLGPGARVGEGAVVPHRGMLAHGRLLEDSAEEPGVRGEANAR